MSTSDVLTKGSEPDSVGLGGVRELTERRWVPVPLSVSTLFYRSDAGYL